MKVPQITTAKKGETLFVYFTGPLDEKIALETLDFSACTSVVIVWSGVTIINSHGIRQWIKWIRTFPEKVNLIYAHCPRAVVDQINMVDEFLPKKAAVLSFLVPYYCNSCEYLTEILYTSGKEFSPGKINAPQKIPCSKCSKESELDVVESKYFRFITNPDR